MKISVVISVRNRKEEIKRCIESLLNQDYPKKNYEIVVVDDGSDQDLSFLNEMGVKYFKQDKLGPAVGRNRGIKESKGSIILFTDSDCTHSRNWISEIVNSMSGEVGCVGGITIDQKNKGIFNLLIADGVVKNRSYFPTNNVGYLRRALEDAGGFNEKFDRPGAEDVELCLKVQEKGYKMRENIKAEVYHHHLNTLKGKLKQNFNFGYGDSMFMLIHPDKKKFRPFFIFYIPFLGLKISSMQLKERRIYFPMIYIINLMLLTANFSGKILHAFRNKNLKLILYIPLHKI